MTEMRRLDVPKKGDLFGRGRASPVRAFDISQEEAEDLRKRRPELLLAREAGVMLLKPEGRAMSLHYGFSNLAALRESFGEMLEELSTKVKPAEAPAGIFVRLTDLPNRPYIEPLLSQCSFSLVAEWVELVLRSLPQDSADENIAAGFLFRPAAPGDYEAIATLDRESFGNNTVEPEDVAYIAETAAELRLLEEKATGRLAGYLGLFLRAERTGEVAPLAVHPDFRRRGLATAMLRWALAWFRGQGMRRAVAATRSDNGPALALFRGLGFTHERSSLTYRRPTTKHELDEIASKRKGTYIKFGGWR